MSKIILPVLASIKIPALALGIGSLVSSALTKKGHTNKTTIKNLTKNDLTLVLFWNSSCFRYRKV